MHCLPESRRPHTEATALRSSLVSFDATLRLTLRASPAVCASKAILSCGDFSGCERTKVHSRHDERYLSCGVAATPGHSRPHRFRPEQLLTVRGDGELFAVRRSRCPEDRKTGPRKWNGLPAAQVESQGALSKRMSTAAPSLVVS